MRVLVAPQEFKGSLSAEEAAAAIGRGIQRARPGWEVDLLPLSDGGPGLIEALRRALPSDTRATVAHDALGRPILARFLALRTDGTAVVEAAQANGLYHLAPGELSPLMACTYGVGEVILAAAEERPRRMIVGVGGSATTDGGAGMARALGARLLDARGGALPRGGAALADLARVEWRCPPALGGIDLTVATDVTSPLLGPEGTAAVFAPQKGASPADVALLEAALARFAAVVERDLGVSIGAIPGGGAAGGLAAGLVAFLGARIASGFEVVAKATGLHARLARADVVVTGEGSFDSQSFRGKTTGRILELSREAGKPAFVVAGRAEGSAAGQALTLASLEPDSARSIANAGALLERLAQEWAAGLL